MSFPTRRTSAAIAALATAGVSSLFMGAVPASAASLACGAGDLVPGTTTCAQTFTSTVGTTIFTPDASMTTLEVLLVGGGGDANSFAPAAGTAGYAAAGGGAEVKIVDFHTHNTTPFTVTVGAGNSQTAVATTGLTATAAPGGAGGASSGGSSGAGGFAGGSVTDSAALPNTYGAGAGAGGAASGITAGAGIQLSSLTSGLFTTDTRCFGGGGAVAMSGVAGVPGCGGGSANAADTTLTPPAANRGGGGGAGLTAGTSTGGSGYVEIRWNAPTVSLAFSSAHGSAIAPETVVLGTAPVAPADPAASGYVFQGWYTDPAFTTAADFSAPLAASTTFYARFAGALAATGAAPNSAELPIGLATLVAGALLLTVVAGRRRRTAN